MKSSIISAIAALASFAAASPILNSRDALKVFTLVAGSDAPADIAGHTLQLSAVKGGSLGWFADNAAAVDGTYFIQNNAKSGITFYSIDTAYEM